MGQGPAAISCLDVGRGPWAVGAAGMRATGRDAASGEARRVRCDIFAALSLPERGMHWARFGTLGSARRRMQHPAPSCTASIAAARQARWLAGETLAPRAIGCAAQRGGRAQRLCAGLFLAHAARKTPAREGVLLGLWPAQRSHARCDTPEILRRAANVNPAGVSLQCLSAVSPPARGARNKVATPSPSSSLRWSMDHLACAFLLDRPLSRPATFIGARTSAALIITAARLGCPPTTAFACHTCLHHNIPPTTNLTSPFPPHSPQPLPAASPN